MQFSRNMNCSSRVCPLDESVVYGFSAGSMPWLRSVNTQWFTDFLGFWAHVSVFPHAHRRTALTLRLLAVCWLSETLVPDRCKAAAQPA